MHIVLSVMITPFRINRTNDFMGRMSPKPDAVVLDASGSEYSWNVINYPLKSLNHRL